MANAIYPKYKEALLNGSANTNMSSGTVKVALVDTGTYTYSSAHEFLSSLTGQVGTDQTLTTKTFTNGTFDADNATWTAVVAAQLAEIEAERVKRRRKRDLEAILILAA